MDDKEFESFDEDTFEDTEYTESTEYVEEVKNRHSVHHSSKSQTWNTPRELFDPINEIWKFTLDVACLPSSALCSKFFTPEDNGLMQDWSNDVAWCNPPYDDIKTWTRKCSESYEDGGTVMMLIPSRTDTKAFQDFIATKSTCVCFLRGRLKFDNPSLPSWREDGTHKKGGAPFPSVLVIFDDNMTEEKYAHLNKIGMVMQTRK